MITNNVTVYQFEVGLDEVFADCGQSMQFVDPDRIEQSDQVQAASFAPILVLPLVTNLIHFL